MQNKTKKPEKTISLPNLPGIIITVVLIVGIGAVYGLIGYLFSGIKENITPVIQKPSLEITNNYFGNEFIQVKLPQKNATIKNPVSISGKANVYEANVRVRILDDNKNILTDTFITADGWMDKLYSFGKEIDYETPQTENGLIEIFEESVKDGSEIYKVEVPVVFGDYEDAFSDWKIYRNEEYGYEIKYPEDWKNEGNTDDYFFQTFFESKNAEFLVRTNQLDSVSPFTFPSSPTCRNEGEFVVLSDNNLPKIIFSSFQEGISEKKCNDFLLDEHLILGEFCVDKNLKVYPAEVIKGRGEYLFYCGEETDLTTLLDFQLFCKGDEWQKKEGLEKCNELFDQILSTFKFIEKDEIVDWKVYQNEEFGFEFKYPEDYSLKEPSNNYIYLKSKDNETIFGRIVNIEIEEKTLINDKFSLSDASKISFEEFISKNIKVGCAASRSGLDGSLERYCTNEIEIKPFLNTKGITGYEIYITEITETKIAGKTTTEKRKKGPIFAFNISEYNLNRGLLFQLSGEVEESLEKEMYSKILNQILSTFKFIEKDEIVDENKPSIYSSEGERKRGRSLLLLNGEKTSFPAYEFEKENIILFQEEIYDEEKSQNHYSLKTISTVSPYEIKTLIDDRHTNCMDNSRFLGEKNNVYFFETEVSAPGSYYELFLFDPVNMDFVLIKNLHHYKGYHLISLYSSASKVSFNFEKRSGISSTGKILLLNDNDIEIIFNEKSFTKKEVDQGKSDYIKDIFNYNFAPFAPINTDEINNKESNDSVDAYLKYFPKKIPYFASEWYKYEGAIEDFWTNPDGYFDFEKNEFVSSL